MPKRFWAELTTREIDALDRERTVAVLPVAATEQHGPHLPLGTDTMILDALIAATIGRLPPAPPAPPVLFLPTLAIGKSNEHQAFAGTLSLSAKTLLDVWMEIGASVAASGVRRLVLLNGHGGQSGFMQIVNHDLRARERLMVWSIDWFRIAPPAGLFAVDELRYGIHGGDVETSLMLAIAPARVDLAQARRFDSTLRGIAGDHPPLADGVARWGWQTQDLNPAGAVGDAAAATAEKGRAVLAHVAAKLAAQLATIAELPSSLQIDGKADGGNGGGIDGSVDDPAAT
ncbi:MAG: creatininase family protein [Lautropia sp.]